MASSISNTAISAQQPSIPNEELNKKITVGKTNELNVSHLGALPEIASTREKVEKVARWMILNVRGCGRCQTWAMLMAKEKLLPLPKAGISQFNTTRLNFPGGSHTPIDSRLEAQKNQLDQLIKEHYEKSFQTGALFRPLLAELFDANHVDETLKTKLQNLLFIYDTMDRDSNLMDPKKIFGANSLEELPEEIKKLHLMTNQPEQNKQKLSAYILQEYVACKPKLDAFLTKILSGQPGYLVFGFAANYLKTFKFTILQASHNPENQQILTFKAFEGETPPAKVWNCFVAHFQDPTKTAGHYKLAVPVTAALQEALDAGVEIPGAEFFRKNTSTSWIEETSNLQGAAHAGTKPLPHPSVIPILSSELLSAANEGNAPAIESIRRILCTRLSKEFQLITIEKNSDTYSITLINQGQNDTILEVKPEKSPTTQSASAEENPKEIISQYPLETFLKALQGDTSSRADIRREAIACLNLERLATKQQPQQYQPNLVLKSSNDRFTATIITVDNQEKTVVFTPNNSQTTPPNSQTTPPNSQTTPPNSQTTPPKPNSDKSCSIM